MMEKVNIAEKFTLFSEHWSPKIVGELNGQQVKLVKFSGEFVWHQHEDEDELFLVVKGSFRMELRDKSIELHEGEFLIVPHGAWSIGLWQREEVHVCSLNLPPLSIQAMSPMNARLLILAAYRVVFTKKKWLQTGPLSHLGFQVATVEQVQATRNRLIAAGMATFDEKDATCCYALQDKV